MARFARTHSRAAASFLATLCLLGPTLLAAAHAESDEPAGPVPVPVLAPRFAPLLLFPPPGREPAMDTMGVTLGMASGQVWKGDAGPAGSVGVSAQTLCPWISGKWGITDFLEAGWELPVVYHARSFKKAEEPFHLRIEYGDALLVDRTKPGGGLSDARFSVGFSHRNPRDPLRRLRITAAVKAPSGRTRAFEGTGRADFGGFLDGTVALHGRWFVHGLVGVVRLGSPSGLSGGRVDFKTAIPFRAALEFRAASGLGCLAQIEGANNPYPETGHPRLDEHPVQVTLALSLRWSGSVETFVAFTEDLSRSAPDFAVTLGMTFWIP